MYSFFISSLHSAQAARSITTSTAICLEAVFILFPFPVLSQPYTICQCFKLRRAFSSALTLAGFVKTAFPSLYTAKNGISQRRRATPG